MKNGEAVKNGTFVAPCKCKNEFQDKAYGPRMRLFNKCKDGGRCTTCSFVLTVN